MLLDVSKTRHKLAVSAGQCLLRVGPDEAGNVSCCKQQIAKLQHLLLSRYAGLNRFLQLIHFLADFGQYVGGIVPIEAYFGRLLLQLVGFHECRQIAGNTAKRRLRFRLHTL
ncbi:hypothetical protein D3C86_1942430 [compost metagenome]